MKKALILLAFFSVFGFATQSQAQCGSFGCASPGYYYDLANFTYFWNNAPGYLKTAYAVDMGFQALFSSIALVEHGQAVEKHINARLNNLENYKSVKRYYTEGIPPFADRGPDGRPRSPKITWADVQSIE